MGDLGLNKTTLKRKLSIVTSGEAVGTNQPQTFLKPQSFASGLILTGDVTPPVISADQNNYNPTGLADANVLRLATNNATPRNITGLTSQGDDRVIIVHNVGPGDIILVDESASSTAANRFAVNANFTLSPDQSLLLDYDLTSSRWRIASGETGPPTGPAGGDLTGTYPNPVIAANAVSTAEIIDDSVTNAKLANMPANTARVNATASAADPQDLVIPTNSLLGRVGANIVAAPLVTAQITDDNVTFPKIQNIATSRILGRLTAAAGDIEELTGAQATTLLSYATNNIQGAVMFADDLEVGALLAVQANDSRLSDSRPPTGAAGGDLSGTYPNPQILAGAIVDADINASGITTRTKLPALLAYEDEANTWTQIQTYQAEIILENLIAIQGKNIAAVPVNIAKIDASNILIIGDTSNQAETQIFAGTGGTTAAIRAVANGQVINTKMAQAATAEVLHRWLMSDVSSGTGYLQIENDTATDAQFIPVIEAYQGQSANNVALVIRAYGSTNSGTVPILVLDSRIAADITSTTKPLVDIRGNAISRLQVQAKGGMFQTVVDDVGVGSELFYQATLEGNAVSYFKILNADPANARFGPWLFAFNDNTTAFPALHLYGAIVAAADTGTTQGVMVFDSRQSAAQVTTRPLIIWKNFGTEVWRINPKGDILQTVIASTGAAETLHTWTVSDSAGYIKIINQLSTDAVFVPQFMTYNATGGSGSMGFRTQHYIPVLDDAGGNPMYVIDVRLFNDTALLVKPLFDIRNANVSKWLMSFDGKVTHTITGQTGVAEVVQKWVISDDASGLVQLENSTATDGAFVPLLRIRTPNTTAATLLFDVPAASDTGALAVGNIICRNTAAGAITTRALIEVFNAGSSIFRIDNDGEVLQQTTNQDGHIIYRKTSTVGSAGRNAIRFDMQTANTTQVPYGYLLYEIADNTDTLEDSHFRIYVKNNGVLLNPFVFTNAGSLSIFAQAIASGQETPFVCGSSDGGASNFTIVNSSTADGFWGTQFIMRSVGASAGVQNFYTHIIANAQDTGTSPVTIFRSYQDLNAVLTVRPLFAFYNFTTECVRFNCKGDILQTIAAQAGVAEVMHKWQLSENQTSYVQIANTTGTDGKLAGGIIFRHDFDNISACGNIIAEVNSLYDSGSSSILTIWTRTTGGASTTNRPLIKFLNGNTSYCQTNPDGDFLHTIAAQVSAEIIHKWVISDDTTGFFQIENGTSTATQFRPTIRSRADNGLALLVIGTCIAASDTGSAGMVQIDSQRTAGAITVRPLLIFSNNFVAYWLANPDGGIVQTIVAGGSEVLNTWAVSDAAGSAFKIVNPTGAAGVFAPQIEGINREVGTTRSGLYIVGEILSTQDSGTVAAVSIRPRLSTAAALVTRPLLAIENFNVAVATFGVASLLFAEAYNIQLGTTTGSMIGTTISQKLGFWGKTPVTQPVANPDTTGATLAALETEVNEIKALLRLVGLMA